MVESDHAALRGADGYPVSVARRYVQTHPGEGVLVALSGGSDSVALLLALSRVFAEGAFAGSRGLSALEACWVDHAIRPEGEIASERAFIEDLALRHDIPLSIREARSGELREAARTCGGLESAAREFRYRALREVMCARGLDRIVTAHTRDDQVETVLMRALCGSGSGGLRGIPPSNGTIDRPFLRISKEKLLLFVRNEGESFRVDSTNAQSVYLRNKIRNEVLPFVKHLIPDVETSLITLSLKAAMDDDALGGYADALVKDGRIDAAAYVAAPAAVRLRALYALAGPYAKRIPFAFMRDAACAQALEGDIANGAGVRIARAGPWITVSGIQPVHGRESSEGYAFIGDSGGEFRIGKDTILAVYYGRSPSGLRTDAWRKPLILRSRLPGDMIRTVSGNKKLDELLSELGVPREWRNIVPVAEDREGIVAVMAAGFGARDIYRENSALNERTCSEYLETTIRRA